jgi:hypothetical protein
MRGIVGYAGQRQALGVVVDGLSRALCPLAAVR